MIAIPILPSGQLYPLWHLSPNSMTVLLPALAKSSPCFSSKAGISQDILGYPRLVRGPEGGFVHGLPRCGVDLGYPRISQVMRPWYILGYPRIVHGLVAGRTMNYLSVRQTLDILGYPRTSMVGSITIITTDHGQPRITMVRRNAELHQEVT